MHADLAHAAEEKPDPMTDAQAFRLVRRIWSWRGATRRAGVAHVVALRSSRRSHKVVDIGVGSTWEKAVDAALRNRGC